MKRWSPVFYVLSGAMLGFAMGILVAPSAGKETQRRLKYAAGKFRDRLGLAGNEFAESEMEMDASHSGHFGAN